MILRLAAEQARSQKRYTIWTAALMTLALAFVSFGLLLVATQRAMWEDVQRASLYDRTEGIVGAQFFGEQPDAGGMFYGGNPSVADVDQSLAEAIADGSDVAAVRQWSVVSRPVTAFPYFPIAAATGDYDWDLVLAEGSLPGDGEILLDARIASELDLGVGDTIDLLYRLHQPSAEEPASEADWHTYTISGLARSCGVGGTLIPDAGWMCPDYSYVSWKASSSPNGPLTYTTCPINESGDTAPCIPMAAIAWNIDHPALAGLPAPWLLHDPAAAPLGGLTAPRQAVVGYGLAGLVAIGMLLVALAVGRSQAQARVQWVATARTLGATRRGVVGATLLESLLVAAAATVGSLALGYALASVAYPWLRGFSGPTIGPDFVPMPLWVIAAVALGGAALSLVVAAVPAFWASRVSPVAAFKPVTDVTEVELSPRVPLWWVFPAFVGGLALILLGTRGHGSAGFAVYVGAILAGTAGFVLLKEGLSALVVTAGRRFSRSRSPVLQVTGDGFVSSPRSAVTLALLFALPAALVSLFMLFNNFWNLETHIATGLPSSTWPLPDHESAGVWGTAGVLWAAVLLVEFEAVALAITFASRWASAGEAATRRALGLSTLHQRQAAFIRHAAPQIGGAVVGSILGFVLGIGAYFLAPGGAPRPGSAGDYLPAWWYSFASAGYGVLLVAAFASFGALVVAAAASRVRPPVAELKPTGKVHVR